MKKLYKLLTIFLSMVCFTASGQYFVKHNGQYVVHYGSFVKSGPSSVPSTVTIVSATVENSHPEDFIVTFSDNIDGTSPDVSEWTITVNSIPYEADDYLINYDEVWFNSGSLQAEYGDVITISYNGDSWVSYPNYYLVEDYSNYPVTNNVNPPVPTEFYALMDMDFESESVGAWTQSDIETWAALYTNTYDISVYDAYAGELCNIVYDTIYTGTRSKVFEVGNRPYDLWHGFESDLRFPGDTIHQELYVSYLFKFEGENTYLNGGGKIAGFTGLPFDPEYGSGNPIRSGYGMLIKMNFNYAKIYDYHYTQDNPVGSSPWSSLTGPEWYYYDTIYLNHGNWYVLTIRKVINTYSGGPVDNAISEGWINGRMIFNVSGSSMWFDGDLVADDYYDYSSQADIDNIGITAVTIDHFYGGTGTQYTPWVNMHGYFGRVVVYKSPSDPTWGTHNLHDPDDFLVQPISFPTNNRYFYDVLFNSGSPISFSDGSYGGTSTDTCTSNHYLFDAGPGGTVDFEITTTTWNNKGHVVFYDGDTVTSAILYDNQATYVADMSSSVGTISSTQRCLYVRVDRECTGTASTLTGTVTLNDMWYLVFLILGFYKRTEYLGCSFNRC